MGTDSAHPSLTPLLQLLRLPIRVLDARELRQQAAMKPIPERIVDCPRLLLVLRGTLRYRFENRVFSVPSGRLLLVPAYARRSWTVATQSVTIRYVNFETNPPLRLGLYPRIACPRELAVEREAFGRVIRLLGTKEAIGELEGELKAILARFWTQAVPVSGFAEDAADLPVGIRAAMAWLEAHHADADAGHDLHERAGLSLWHFRRVFRQLVGQSPQGYLTATRMRAARFHLAERGLSIKETAARVGYADPLYFSRAYRRFWGHPPTHDAPSRKSIS